MRADYTHIVILLDRSGSMQSIRDDMQGALDAFIFGQRSAPGSATLSLFSFDDFAEELLSFAPLTHVPAIKLEPRGSTALIDAWCQAVDKTGKDLAAIHDDERPGTVVFVVITDGQENASRHHRRSDVADRVTRQRDVYRWEFIYLGANQDAVTEAAQYGVTRGSTLTYAATGAGTRSSTQALGNYVASTRVAGADTQTFTEQDRDDAS